MYVLIQIFLLNDKLARPVAIKRIGESAIWADLTIRLAMKANIMSARIDLMAYGEGSGVECVTETLSEVCVGSLLKEWIILIRIRKNLRYMLVLFWLIWVHFLPIHLKKAR